MKIKTKDLTGPALDWAVAECEGNDFAQNGWKPVNVFLGARVGGHHRYSTDWSQGGPIKEREGISDFKYNKLDPKEPDKWGAHKVVQRSGWREDLINVALCLDGPTPLVAAMRCFVASKLGDEVDVPEELT